MALSDNENVIVTKSYAFALRIIKLYRHLLSTKREYVLSKQILRSGASIGANIFESQQAQSKKDFVSKLSIALKESHETKYWLMLLHDSELITETQYEQIVGGLVEVIKILTSIIKTSKIDI